MSDLYLIAHKVRGEPAFDVAVRMDCPLCREDGSTVSWGCHECDQLGYWWIIPTSGHRAYPYHYWPWDELACDSRRNDSVFDPVPVQFGDMPPNLPDHYPTRATPTTTSLAARLGITPRPQVVKITRRL